MQVDDARRTGPRPFSDHLGFEVVSVAADGERAEVVMRAHPGPEHCNSGGIVHGGFLAALLDSATGVVIHAHLEPGRSAPHLQLNVQYLRAALPGTPVECRARVVTAGRRVYTAEAEVFQDDRLVARATCTNLVSDR